MTDQKQNRMFLPWSKPVSSLDEKDRQFLKTASVQEIIEQLKSDDAYVVVEKLVELIAHGAEAKAKEVNAVREIDQKWRHTMFDNNIWIAFALMELSEVFGEEESA